VRKIFEEVEQQALKSLPPDPFPMYQEGRRKVHRDGHIEVARSYYSVPHEYQDREVWVRYDSRLVRVYNDNLEQIAVHGRADLGRFSTHRGHIPDEKISAVERGSDYLMAKAERIGPEAGRWAQAMLQERGLQGIRVLQGFVGLTRKHSTTAINSASRVALDARLFRLRPLRELCRRLAERETPEFMDDHPIIRPLSTYQELLKAQPVERR
jgi:hypothetical protein